TACSASASMPSGLPTISERPAGISGVAGLRGAESVSEGMATSLSLSGSDWLAATDSRPALSPGATAGPLRVGGVRTCARRAAADRAQRDCADSAAGAVDGRLLCRGLGLLSSAAAGQGRGDQDAGDEPAAERRCACGEEVN